jgi:dihydroorotate dehydrogenase
MAWYRLARPLIQLLSPEAAHAAGLKLLQLPVRWATTPSDPFTWQGLTFRNRVGIAAGFDKNATALPGIERLGVGFVEVGTILVEPWPGNPGPRLERLYDRTAIWNKLGFPNDGLMKITPRLAAFPRHKRQGMIVACNIGPHPGHLKTCNNPAEFLTLARTELCQLVDGLVEHADCFVVNLSSPNTAGLRGMLSDPRLATELVQPLRQHLGEQATRLGRSIPLLMKLPPDDPNKVTWTRETLEPVITPLVDLSDGFVAVNTSTRLTQELLQRDAGGISGGPLLPVAIASIQLLRSILGAEKLIIGCGGITQPEHAVQLVQAGAQLVELYSGMIFAGPALPSACARALLRDQPCK